MLHRNSPRAPISLLLRRAAVRSTLALVQCRSSPERASCGIRSRPRFPLRNGQHSRQRSHGVLQRSTTSRLGPGPGRLCGRSPLRRRCRDAVAVHPSEENPRPGVRPSSRHRATAHPETRACHRRFPREGRTARRRACSQPRETAHRRTRRPPQADHTVRAIPAALAHENHHDPTGVACELDSRRANLA